MEHAAAEYLSVWTVFYATIGTAAAALMGLLFVVITLLPSKVSADERRHGTATFTSPTLLHFCGALFVSLLMLVPWRTLTGPSLAVGLCGFVGTIIIARTLFHARRVVSYSPDFEDFSFYTLLPFVAYCVLLVAGALLPFATYLALDGVALGALSLIFLGVRNAWDVVTYIAIEAGREEE